MISKRLQLIADMVTPGHIPADIGTDHAYVPIRLIQDKKAGKAYAMDIGAGPLERAKEHIRAEGLEDKIEVRLSDGLAKLARGEADAVIIAGMGGALTVRILTDGMDVLEGVRELVLSPHSEIEKVRGWVRDHGYEIMDEEMLIDDGKFYTVLRAERPVIPGETVEGEITQSEIAQCGITQGEILPDETRQDETRQGETRQGETRQDETRQGETRQGETRQDEIMQGETDDRQDKITQKAAVDLPVELAQMKAADLRADLREEVYLRYGKKLIEKRHPVLRQALDREEQVCQKIMSSCPASNTERIKELQHRLRMIEEARKLMTDETERGE